MQIYNTMTRKKEELVPLVPGQISMYACGPTVYNFFHIGNARPFIVFDTLRRYLEYRGYNVRFVQNFTDIDDKMIRRANEEGTTVKALGLKQKDAPFKHGAVHEAGALKLFDSYHCSRYNTNTRVLTPEMFRAVFASVRDYLG